MASMRSPQVDPSEVRERALAAIAAREPCDSASLAETLGWTVSVADEVVAILLRFERVEAQRPPEVCFARSRRRWRR